MTAVDLELTLRPAGHGYQAEARCLAPGSEAPIDAAAIVQIDPARLRELALDPAAYGLALGQMVLVQAISRALVEARVAAKRANVPLRLRLVVPAELHQLRWETLRDPAHPDAPLLTTGGQILFSRYLSSADWTPVGPRPLGGRRALVLLASPSDLADYGLAPFDVAAERAIIEQSLTPIPTTVLGAGQATLDVLVEALRSGPDILYLMAHGRVDAAGETWLYLEGAGGKTEPVRGGEVAARIAEQAVRPQLVILGSCESAGDGHGEALLTLGPLLARAGVGAVLAMQGKVTQDTLRTFLPACLRVLIEDGRVDAAVSHARGLVRVRSDFWAPVLFLRLLSGRLWVVPGAGPETPEELLERMPTDQVPANGPPLAPISRLRLLPNPQFVGREAELRQLAAQLKAGKTVAITTGIGGVGKTQLARMFAEHYGGYFAGGVFWLSFAEPSGIVAEVAACGMAGLVERPDFVELKQDAQVELVRVAWQQPVPRLLIFDNCEEEALLREWLPKLGECRVLVTSRRAVWSPVLTMQTLALGVLPRTDSVRLLQRLAQHLNDTEAGQIAEMLGDLPLALHLAGCYLARYCISVADYLTKLASVQLRHHSLQGRGVESTPTDREPNVEKAFALSFARLEVSNPINDLIRRLLARAACFAPGEPFKRQWLEATITPEGDEEEQQLARTDAVERLLSLGLLESVSEGLVRLHRLLATYTASTLSDAEALPAVERVVARLFKLASETRVPQAMLLVLTHLRYLVQRTGEREDELAVTLCIHLAVYLEIVGAYAEAQPLYERALAIRERVLGSDHLDTAASLNNLGGLYRAQGAYAEARPLLERSLAIWERLLGSDHIQTATGLNNLAGLYRAQGAYAEARLLLERALAISEQVLGSDHTQTAGSLNNLAGLLGEQGEYVEARRLYERALAIRERVLGSNHPDTATILNNLALLYKTQGAYREAQPLYERALAIWEQELGSDHPQTATGLNNLAELYQAQRQPGEAQPLYERALAIRERVLGSDHPDTAASLNNLALLYQVQGGYGKARPLLERALEIAERVLGSDHLQTAGILNNLAVLYARQGQFTLAFPLLERAIIIRQAQLGPTHLDTVQAQQSLVAMRQDATVAALPEGMRAALQAGDNTALRQVFQALPLREAQTMGAQLASILADQLERLSQAIVAIAQGNNASRLEIEVVLAQLEARGYHLVPAVQAIWAGQRNPAMLTACLDATSTGLVKRVLALLKETDEAKRRAELLSRAETRVVAVGDDPHERAELAERFMTVAASYASGNPEDQALAVQIQALAAQLIGGGEKARSGEGLGSEEL